MVRVRTMRILGTHCDSKPEIEVAAHRWRRFRCKWTWSSAAINICRAAMFSTVKTLQIPQWTTAGLSQSDTANQRPVAVGPEQELSAHSEDLRRGGQWHFLCTGIRYWQCHKDRYPLLFTVALDLVSAPASKAYTERIFNVCGDLRKRNRTAHRLIVEWFWSGSQYEDCNAVTSISVATGRGEGANGGNSPPQPAPDSILKFV